MSLARLIDALSSDDPSDRVRAAEELARLGREAVAAVPALVRAASDSSVLVQVSALRALAAIGKPAGAVLERVKQIAAMTRVEEVCEAAAMAMYRISGTSKEATIFLQALVTMGRDAQARARAASDLGEIGAREAVPALIHGLDDSAAAVRREAAYALGRIGAEAKDALPALEKLLLDQRDDHARIACAEALWSIAQRTAGIPFLCTLVVRTGGDISLRVRAMRALGKMGVRARAALPYLVEAMDEPNVQLRRALAETLLKIQPTLS
jgi:HEAT repeat protein